LTRSAGTSTSTPSTRATGRAGTARTASSHTGTGAFCYSFNPHGPHPAGKGLKYRATVEGPGVTPDVMWEGESPGSYSRAADAQANAAISQLDDRQCKPN